MHELTGWPNVENKQAYYTNTYYTGTNEKFVLKTNGYIVYAHTETVQGVFF